MSNVFYYDSNEFTFPAWLVEDATKQERNDFKKYFIESYNFLVGEDFDLSKEKLERLANQWAVMMLECNKK